LNDEKQEPMAPVFHHSTIITNVPTQTNKINDKPIMKYFTLHCSARAAAQFC